MKARWMTVAALVAALSLTAAAQQEDGGQQPGDSQGGRGMRMGPGRMGQGMMGQGVVGAVTDVASDHYTVKTIEGDTYTVHFSANTRFMKQPPAPAGQQGAQGQQRGFDRMPPTPIKSSDIKVGDVIMARGEVAPGDKSVGAMFIVQVDPERAKQMQQMEASFGKTWLMGRITAIDGARVTLEGGPNHGSYSFVADENTEFRSRRQPITLADLTIGENVRVEGTLKDGQFVATSVNAMMPRARGGPAPRQGTEPPQ